MDNMSVCLSLIWLLSSTVALARARGQSTCVHGFIDRDIVDTTLHSTRLTIPHEERRIIPGISFNCSGVIAAWTIGARWRTDGLHNFFPHLQIWRQNGFDSTYFVVGDSELFLSNDGSLSGGDYTIKGNLEPPLNFQRGDVLGMFQPPESRSRIGVYYDANRGPPNYYIDTGSAFQPPLASFIATGLSSNRIQDGLPLISVNIAFDATIETSTASGIVTGGELSSISCRIHAAETLDANFSIAWIAQINSTTVATLTGSNRVLTHNFTASLNDAGVYMCSANVTSPYHDTPRFLSSTVNVTVQIPTPTLTVTRDPGDGVTLQHGDSVALTCTIQLDRAVDRDVTVVGRLSGPGGSTTAPILVSSRIYRIVLMIQSLSGSPSSIYTCTASISPSLGDTNLEASEESFSTLDIAVGFIVHIKVSYNPPPGVVLGPNEYRAASGPVIVQCMTLGGTGTINYHWSSTCRNCTFQSSTSNTINRTAVHSGDIGIHTCTVTSQYHSSSANIIFNVVGTGIYVVNGIPRGYLANNSLVTLLPEASVYHLRLFCRSDSMMKNVGLLIGLDGRDIRYNDSLEITNPQPGEIRVQNIVDVSNDLTASEQGVYTCLVPLQSGETNEINIGIYPSGFTTPPRITEFVFSAGFSSSNLTCISTGSPATTVSWVKDGQPLTIDGVTYRVMQTVTNRTTSTYDNVLTIYDQLSDVIRHRYVCSVSNILGTDSSSLLTAVISIKHSGDPTAGKLFSLSCMVNMSLHLQLGEPTIEFLSRPDINDDDFAYNGSLAYVHTIVFPTLRTSHGGEFTCQANFSLLTITDTVTLSVKIPAPTLIMTRDPDASVALHHGDSLSLTCIIQLDPAVDSDVVVTGELRGSRGTTMTLAIVSNTTYQMILAISSLRATLSDVYTCAAIVSPGPAVINVLASRPNVSTTLNVTIGLTVNITVSYLPPPGIALGPNEYQAASGPVDVTCIAVGGSGAVSFQWSSTCRSCPFQSSFSRRIYRAAVHSGDTGIHTCTAVDETGNSGNGRLMFNVVGSGIHVFQGIPKGNFENNSLVTLLPEASVYHLRFFCRSDSMMENVGMLIGLDGRDIRYNDSLEITYPQPGELRVQNIVDVSNNLTSSEQGVYTCRIPLQSGETNEINIGIYPSGFTTPPRITEFVFSAGFSSSNLTCTSTGSPATTVSWVKDGQPLTIDGVTYRVMQTVTNRTASTYDNVLTIYDQLSDVIRHRYVCSVSNILGTDSSSLLTAVISIKHSGDPTAGKPFSLSCIVNMSLHLQLGEPTVEFLSPPDINDDDFAYNGSLAYVHTIVFPTLRTSHGGEFTCQATFSLLNITDTVTLSVKIPAPTVIMTRDLNASMALHHGDPLSLTCIIQLDPAVDSDVVVTGELRGSRGTTRTLTMVSNTTYQMIIAISSLRATLFDVYTCAAIVSPGPAVQNVLASRPDVSTALNVTIGLTVNITVSYLPPPGIALGPNEYRAASGPVNVNCIAVGGSGAVRFQWSSTCRSCPFQSAASQTISRAAVHSGDTGIHTCTAVDGTGNSGNGSITFNIVGAGIHVFNGLQRGSFPNNGLVVADETDQRFKIRAFCRSDSTRSNVGELIGPEGHSIHTTDPFDIDQSQPGELRIIVFSSATLTERHHGIYTCRMPLENGVVKEINIGFYSGFTNPPTITSVILSVEPSYLTLTCTSTGSPATTVTWTVRNGLTLTMRDGDSVSVNMVNYQLTQTVINRKNSTYANRLTINTTSVEDITGYKCEVANALGSSTKKIDLGVTILAVGPARVGEDYTLTCTVSGISNIAFSFEWLLGPGIAGNTANRQLSLGPLVLSDAGNYTCTATTNVIDLTLTASQEIRIAIPSPMVEVTHDGGSPVFSGSVLTLTCTITLDTDVVHYKNFLTVTNRWYGPRGLLTNGTGITVTPPVTSLTEDHYTSTVILNTVSFADAGSYSCEATVRHTTSQFTIDGMNSNEMEIELQAPNMTLSLTPNTTHLPNMAPYNTFSLTCTATAPEGVVSPKTFTWWRQNAVTNNNLAKVVSNDKFNIINSALDQPVSTSVLMVTETTVGIWQFYCQVLLGDIRNTSDVHSIYVTGPADPNPPTYFVASSITMNSAIICLFIPFVTFTPETYVVHYGTSITAVDSTSIPVESANFSAENFKIVLTLTSFTPNTMYFYLINVSNTETSVVGPVETFETEMEQGAHCINTTAVVVGCVVGVALLAVLVIAASVVVTSIVLKRRKHRVDLSTTSHTDQAKYKAGTETAECVAYHQVERRHGRATRGSETSDQPNIQQNPVYENIPRCIQAKTVEIQHRM